MSEISDLVGNVEDANNFKACESSSLSKGTG